MKNSALSFVVLGLFLVSTDKSFATGYQGGKESSQSITYQRTFMQNASPIAVGGNVVGNQSSTANTSSNQKTIHYDKTPYGSYKTLEEAELWASKTMDDFRTRGGMSLPSSGECKISTEANISIVKKDGEYYLKDRRWFEKNGSDRKDISTAPGISKSDINALESQGYEFVESFHNHYEGLYEWPTISDVLAAIDTNKPVVVYDCKGGFHRIDPKDGNVFSGRVDEDGMVVWEKEPTTLDKTERWKDYYERKQQYEECQNNLKCRYIGQKPEFPIYDGLFTNGIKRDEFSKFLYDGKHPSFAQLTEWYKASMLDSAEMAGANPKHISMDDLKNMDLDNKKGDWCKCDPPGCINKVKIVKGKHVGFITFECSYCKKINVAFAKAALEFGRVVESEGGDIQWYGANAEERANSAAGNVK